MDYHRVSPNAEPVQGTRRAMDQVAHAVHIDDRPVRAGIVEQSGKLGDPGLFLWHSAASASTCAAARSEEHTSELQSLLRISYAVFCLKNKTSEYPNTIPLTTHSHASYSATHTSTRHAAHPGLT